MKKSKPLQDEAQAMRYALWLLGRRPYSQGSLLEKFRLRALPEPMAQSVMQQLVAKKFVNDVAYTESFVHLKKAQNWGPSKIRVGLYRQKIPGSIIEASLRSAYSSEQEARQAFEVLERQKQRFLRKKEKKEGLRLRQSFEFLVRKGYSLHAARLAVDKVFGYNSHLSDEG